MVAPLSDEFTALERRLAAQARQVGVLEEFGLTHKDYRRLRYELAALFQHHPAQAINILRQHGRYSTAAFLALVGTYRYGQDDDGASRLWPLVADDLKLKSAPRVELGKMVERVVFLGGMATFPKAEGARRFVDLILLHGGIPNGCLDNYFDRVLRHAHPSLSGREVVAAVLEPSQHRYLHKPVARYLQYGGEVAADFVERTEDLASYHDRLRGSDAPDVLRDVASLVGLPTRVVKHYREWIQEDPHRGEQVRGATRRWKSPTLRFDSILLVPVLDLPAQRVDGEDGGQWTLRLDGEATTVEVRSWRRASVWQTDAQVHALLAPQAHYEVEWGSVEGRRRWAISGLSLRWPLLAFHARDGAHVDVSDGLPRDVLWIVRPKDPPFACDGAVPLETPTALSERWSGYVAERWDLSGAEGEPSAGDVKLWLRPEGDLRPHLVGRPLPGVTAGEAPVYPECPTLVVPRARPDEDIGQWTLRWSGSQSEGELPLVDIAAITERGWDVDLAASGLPAFVPLDLRLRGPLGRSARFRASLWPELHVGGASRLAFPAEDDVEISIDLPPDVEVLSTDGGKVVAGTDPVAVKVHPSTDRLNARVRSGEGVRELEVAIPRLRSYVFDAAAAGVSTALATPDPLHVQGDWLDQAAIPRAAFFIGASGVPLDGLEADFGEGMIVSCPRVAGRADVFDLAEVAQAAAMSHRARARFWVSVGHRRAAVGDWHAQLGLEGLSAVVSEDADGTTVRAHWTGGHLVEGVQARLWSMWSPWEPPFLQDVVPDGPLACSARFARIPAGEYLLELAVDDPWSGVDARRPARDDAAVTLVDVGSRQDQADRLGVGEGVRADVTRHLASTGDAVERSQAWRRACAEAEPGDVPLLLSVAGLDAGQDVLERMAHAHKARLFDALDASEKDRSAVVAELSDEDAKAVAAYAVVLGLLDTDPEEWGGPWLPLALCGIGRDGLRDPMRLAGLADRLGLGLSPQTEAVDDDEDAEDEQGAVLSLSAIKAARGPFGEAPNDAMVHLGSDVLRQIRSQLGMVPGGPLSPNAQQLGYFEWLVARCSDARASDALAEEAAQVKRDLCSLRDLNPARFTPAVDAALGREHHLASGRQAPAWLNAPFVVGATAVLLRAQALCPDAREALAGHRAWIRSLALRALSVAPDLFAHDLCWVHLDVVDP